MQRFLRCVDEVLTTCSAAGPGSDTRTVRTLNLSCFDALQASLVALKDDWDREDSRRASSARSDEKGTCAAAWLTAHVDDGFYARMESLLGVVREQAAVAASTNPIALRRKACHAATVASRAAFELLNRACVMVKLAHSHSSSQADRKLARRTRLDMARSTLVLAMAGAVRATTSISTILHSITDNRQPPDIAVDQEAAIVFMAMAVSRFMATFTYDALVEPMACAGLGVGDQLVPEVMATITPVVEALAQSQLLAAAAAALLDSPNVFECAAVRTAERSAVCEHVHGALDFLAQAVFHTGLLRGQLLRHGGPEGERLAVGLVRLMRHDAVRRLQVALLDQLAAEAGMGAELGEGEEQQQEEEEGQQAAGGWASRSGKWWFAQEEARQGKLLGVEAGRCGEPLRSRVAGWLEDYHSNIVSATFGEWESAELGGGRKLEAVAGVPARPPLLLVARLAARTTEALCRLCRGQGLGGAYTPAPEWIFCRSGTLVLDLLPQAPTALLFLPEAAVQACLPYWLEAAAWAVALMSDGTAAAMGRLPVTQREGAANRPFEGDEAEDGVPVSAFRAVMQCLYNFGRRGVRTLSAPAMADVRRRLFRCGLAASLDHTLRLAWSTAEGDRFHADLQVAYALAVMCLNLAPVLPPTDAPASSSAGGCAELAVGGGGGSCSGDSSRSRSSSMAGAAGSGVTSSSGGGKGYGGDGSSAGSGGEGEARDQLGVLLTLSKRAATLTRELEGAGAGAGAVQGQTAEGQGEEVKLKATQGLVALMTVLNRMEPAMMARVEALRRTEVGPGDMDGNGKDESAAWAPGAACVDEAHEAVALAARAACNLAAPLAWRLAADAAAGAAAGSSGAPLREDQAAAVGAVCDLLRRMMGWWRPPLLLPPPQLLACQPQRLLAAVCALAAALPPQLPIHYKDMCRSIACLVPLLASHKTLTGRVRGWLKPPPPSVAAAANDTSSQQGVRSSSPAGTCADCLVAPLQCALQHAMSVAPGHASHAMALLRIAAGEFAPREDRQGCDGGGGGAREEADGGFHRTAAAIADIMQKRSDDPAIAGVVLPDGTPAMTLLATYLIGHDQLPPPSPPPSAPSWPLPPPLALPPGWSGALPRLRVCGNPVCCNFAKEREGALPFKQCGGCRAVRYCGADCQRAHWRPGHRAECKVLAERGLR